MPIYEYRCTACGHELEALQKLSDARLVTCPACGADTLVKKVSAAGFQLKGSGWYVTDFRGGNKGAPASKGDNAATGDAAATGGDKPASTDKAPGDKAAPAATPPAAAPASTSASASTAASTSTKPSPSSSSTS